jgi:predicted transcriptional regulator
MIVVTTKEFNTKQKKYFEIAKKERVAIKRGKNYFKLTTDSVEDDLNVEEWFKEYLSIPEQYRCNPFDISPSGDLFWADKRNVESMNESIAIAEQQYKDGLFTRCETVEEAHKHFQSL